MSFVEDAVVKAVDTLPVFFAPQESASILPSRFLQDPLICEVTFVIKLSIVAVLIFFAGLRPPFELATFSHTIHIGSFKKIAI